jgi:hypothetical protein
LYLPGAQELQSVITALRGGITRPSAPGVSSTKTSCEEDVMPRSCPNPRRRGRADRPFDLLLVGRITVVITRRKKAMTPSVADSAYG